MQMPGTHHVAIICSECARAKHPDTTVLTLEVVGEVYRSASAAPCSRRQGLRGRSHPNRAQRASSPHEMYATFSARGA